MMVSYAQNGEDVLLERAFAGRETGFYVDIGANHPVVCSVTKHFYERGWRGINVEPASVFERLADERPRDINLNMALSDAPGTLTFYEFSGADALSTLSTMEAENHRRAGRECVERLVGVRTLASVCEEFVTGPIDFLSVDVEGHERQVLEGGDWSRWRPRVVLVEATRPNTTIPTHAEWEHILLDAEYLFAQFDGLNRYYVRAEDRPLVEVLRVPVNVFDGAVPYLYLHQIETAHCELEQLREKLTLIEQFCPWSYRLAQRLERLSTRFPRVSSTFQGMVNKTLRAA
ncbi:MAG TPA: FkbM family methyltransferase [Planctomycetaceae bacterium]|nr:FkbM family methyltransferase [Planctomycetaceae bacterium]